MNNLKPEDIVNALYNKFPEIMGQAITGYYKFFKLEQDLISMADENNKTQIIEAYFIQYGKTYFLQEIMSNLIQNEMFLMYIGLFDPISEKVEELVGGGKFNEKIFRLFMVLIFIINLTNVTSVANEFSPFGDIKVDGIIQTTNGILPKEDIIPKLNPLNKTELLDFTLKYGLDSQIPDSKTYSTNVTNMYKEQIIENITKSMSFIDKIFTSTSDFNKLFLKEIKQKVDDINFLTINVNNVLNNVCTSFSEKTTEDLPITLYNLFSRELKEKQEEIQNKLEISLANEMELLNKKTYSEQLNLNGIGIPSDVDNSFSFSNIMKIPNIVQAFVFKKPAKSEEEISQLQISEKQQSPQLDILQIEKMGEIKNNVKEIVNAQLEVVKQELQNKLIEDEAKTIKNEIITTTNKKREKLNFATYLTAICQITLPQYKFNESTGELSIEDMPISRFHLTILAENVHEYYDQVMGLGIKEENEQKIKSLLEKSNMILKIMTQYDLGIAKVFDPKVTIPTMDDFFNNISEMWKSLKNNMELAVLEFPEKEFNTMKKVQEAIADLNSKMKEDAAFHKLDLIENQNTYDLAVEKKMIKLNQSAALNNLTKEGWNQLKEWIGITSAGGVSVIGTVLTEGTNAAINITATIGDNVQHKFYNSISSIFFGIASLGYIILAPLSITLLLSTGIIAVRTGAVNRFFTPPNNQNLQLPQPAPNPNPNPNLELPRRRPNRWGPPLDEDQRRLNALQGRPRATRFGNPVSEEQFRQNIERFGFGGKLTYKKKTRKNKKRKTKKLKGKNKRRNTRNKKGGRTKRR